MALGFPELTVDFQHLDREALLADWAWLVAPHQLPLLVTAMGDVFVQDMNDRSVHRLDTAAGQLRRVADTGVDFVSLLDDPDFIALHFQPGAVGDLRAAGMALPVGMVYGFRIPPHLGGDVDTDNIVAMPLERHLQVLGQLHRQMRDGGTD
ncbi:MAG: hypothetical protein RL026_1144 [Pseudomonadota bacterium]